MRLLKIDIEKAITDEQGKMLIDLATLLCPGMLENLGGTLTDEELSWLVAGMVAGNVDRMLNEATRGFASGKWKFTDPH